MRRPFSFSRLLIALSFQLSALSFLLGQTPAKNVTANPNTGALIWPDAATFASANGLTGGGGGGSGTVTSVNVSGGTTGLSFSGGPITSSGTITLSGTLSAGNGGTGLTSLSANVVSLLGAANYSAMRTLLSLVPSTDVQAYSANLTTYAGITPSANVQSLLGAANYSAMRTLLSLVPGTDVQAYSSTLAAVAGGTYTGATSITTLGTIGTGVWNGTAISGTYLAGPHAFTSLTANAILLGNSTSAIQASDLSYSTPTLSVPTGFTITSAGTAALTAAINNDITITTSGTGIISIPSTVNSSSPTTGALVIGSGTNGGLGVAGTIQTGNDVDSGRWLYVGARTASSGRGGNVRIRDDTGTQRWLVGILGTAAATSFSIYESVAGAERFRIDSTGSVTIVNGARSQAAWTTTGVIFNSTGATITDSTTATSGTAPTAVFHSFQKPTLAAANTTVTTTAAANVYINGDPIAGTNMTLTNAYGLWNAGKTRLDDNLLNTGTTLHQFGATALANIGVSADTTAGILQIKSPTSGTITLTTANALSLTVSGGAAASLTGGAGNMTITSGTGASRTMILRTTTSGSTATTAVTLGADQSALFAGVIATGGAAISSSTALNLPAGTTALSSLRIAHGAAPTSPTNGDFWTTTTSLFGRINGTTRQFVTLDGTEALTNKTVNGNTITSGSGTLTMASAKTLTVNQTTTLDRQSSTGLPVEFLLAVGDETTAITTGTNKVTFRAPYAFTITEVRATLTTVSSSGTPTVDINEAGTTILSTKLTIDASEKTSTTAAVAAVISDTAIADDAEITIDIDVAGTGAAGLKVLIKGYR